MKNSKVNYNYHKGSGNSQRFEHSPQSPCQLTPDHQMYGSKKMEEIIKATPPQLLEAKPWKLFSL